MSAPEDRKSRPLYKTTIVIWSEFDPTEKVELVELAQEATDGLAYCSREETKKVDNPESDPDFDNNEFFGEEDGSNEPRQEPVR